MSVTAELTKLLKLFPKRHRLIALIVTAILVLVLALTAAAQDDPPPPSTTTTTSTTSTTASSTTTTSAPRFGHGQCLPSQNAIYQADGDVICFTG